MAGYAGTREPWPRSSCPPRAPRRELRPSGREEAQGAGAYLVHEHGGDPGDNGQDRCRLIACTGGKSQP
jgi:hypothetical protein